MIHPSMEFRAVAASLVATIAIGSQTVRTETAVPEESDAAEETAVVTDKVTAIQIPTGGFILSTDLDTPAVERKWEEEEADENTRIEDALIADAIDQGRYGEFKITYYCAEAYKHICGTGDGLTCTGAKVQPDFTVAVDPRLIPLGSTVFIDYGDGEVHTYLADDIGGAIKNKRIDVCVATHQEALRLGTTTATVWWTEAISE